MEIYLVTLKNTLKELSIFFIHVNLLIRLLSITLGIFVSSAAACKRTIVCYCSLSDAPTNHIPSYCNNFFIWPRRIGLLSSFMSHNSFLENRVKPNKAIIVISLSKARLFFFIWYSLLKPIKIKGLKSVIIAYLEAANNHVFNVWHKK